MIIKRIHLQNMQEVKIQNNELSLVFVNRPLVVQSVLSMYIVLHVRVFAILDYIENDILATFVPVRKATTYILQKYGPKCEFTCEEHKNWGFVFATKIVINILYNNKQKLAADSVGKDAVFWIQKETQRQMMHLHFIDFMYMVIIVLYSFFSLPCGLGGGGVGWGGSKLGNH